VDEDDNVGEDMRGRPGGGDDGCDVTIIDGTFQRRVFVSGVSYGEGVHRHENSRSDWDRTFIL
jgi:hypothetical protein